MQKKDIIEQVSVSTGYEKPLVKNILESIMQHMTNNMIEGHSIYLRGFGSFVLKKRKEKKGRNIRSNTAIVIPEHYVPAFKPNQEFADKVRATVKNVKPEKHV